MTLMSFKNNKQTFNPETMEDCDIPCQISSLTGTELKTSVNSPQL